MVARPFILQRILSHAPPRCTTLHHTTPHCAVARPFTYQLILLHAPHCNTLHQTATHCAVAEHLQISTNIVARTILHHTAPHCTTLHHIAPHCNALQRTAPHCKTLPYTATNPIKRSHNSQHVHESDISLTHNRVTLSFTSHNKCDQKYLLCTTLHHTTTHYNTLQRTATRCNTLQHAAIHLIKRNHNHISSNVTTTHSTYTNPPYHTHINESR